MGQIPSFQHELLASAVSADPANRCRTCSNNEDDTFYSANELFGRSFTFVNRFRRSMLVPYNGLDKAGVMSSSNVYVWTQANNDWHYF